MKHQKQHWALIRRGRFVRDDDGNLALFKTKGEAEAWSEYGEHPVRVRVSVEVLEKRTA